MWQSPSCPSGSAPAVGVPSAASPHFLQGLGDPHVMLEPAPGSWLTPPPTLSVPCPHPDCSWQPLLHPPLRKPFPVPLASEWSPSAPQPHWAPPRSFSFRKPHACQPQSVAGVPCTRAPWVAGGSTLVGHPSLGPLLGLPQQSPAVTFCPAALLPQGNNPPQPT